MSVYWDTSCVLAMSTEGYSKLREKVGHFTLSHLTELEVVSATVRRSARRAASGDRLLRTALSIHRRLLKVSLAARLDPLFDSARRLAVRHRLGSNDSLHLAAALLLREQIGPPVEMASHDGDLRRAALAEGLAVFPSSRPA